MRLKKLYEAVVQEGIKTDPRDKKLIDEELKKEKEAFAKLSAEDKAFFDRDRLFNPYDDTRILSGGPDDNVKSFLVGIDIDTAELLLCDRLNARSKDKIDLVVSHHPQGPAYAGFYEVMDMQADIFNQLGVPINIGEKLVAARKKEVGRRIHAANHHKAVDAAKLLGIAFMCIHTPADNHAQTFLQTKFDEKKPQDLQGVLDVLGGIEEYKISRRQNVAPHIVLGAPSSRTGRIFVDMTGGTEGPKDIIDSLLAAGIGTVVGMHLSEEHYKKFQDKNINVVVAGHVASDNLGMNLLLDKIEKAEKIKILTCSGFRRVKR